MLNTNKKRKKKRSRKDRGCQISSTLDGSVGLISVSASSPFSSVRRWLFWLTNTFERSIMKGEWKNSTLLEKEKFEREISDGKIEISHKFLGRKI